MITGLIAHVHILSTCRDKLESSVDQWEAYDSHHESLSQWLRDTEASLRGEATLKPDLVSKKNQYEFFKVGTTFFSSVYLLTVGGVREFKFCIFANSSSIMLIELRSKPLEAKCFEPFF